MTCLIKAAKGSPGKPSDLALITPGINDKHEVYLITFSLLLWETEFTTLCFDENKENAFNSVKSKSFQVK